MGLILVMITLSPVGGDHTDPGLNSLQDDLPNLDANSTNFEPFLELSSDSYELGDPVHIFHGLTNDSEYMEGYNYSLTLLKNNTYYTTLAQNQTTISLRETLVIETKLDLELYQPSNYSILFNVSITDTESLFKIQNFEIYVSSGAKVSISALDYQTNSIVTEVYPEFNTSKQMALILLNTGNTNAFDVTLSVSPINQPVGLQLETNNIEIDVLSNQTQMRYNITITPDAFGKGMIQLDLAYNDGLGTTIATNEIISVYTLPRLEFSLDLPTQVVVDSTYDFTITIQDIDEIQALSFKVQIISDLIQFSPNAYNTNQNQETQEYDFIGTALSNGTSETRFIVIFFDPDGIDEIEMFNNLKIYKILNPGESIPIISAQEILIIFLLIVNGIALALIILLFFRRDIRYNLFRKIFNLHYIPDIKYPTKSIIVDGSNISWQEVSSKGKPKIKNILNAVEVLTEYGFEEILVVADAALRYQIENPSDLDIQVKKGVVEVLPAKVDADEFILRLSAQKGSFLLTNDLFKEYRNKYEWIDQRRIPYSIIDSQVFLHPTFKDQDSN